MSSWKYWTKCDSYSGNKRWGNFLISHYRTELIVSPRSPIYSTALDGILHVKRLSVYPKLSRHTLNKRYFFKFKARKPREKEQTMTWIAKNWISLNFLISHYRTFFRRNNVERKGKRHNFCFSIDFDEILYGGLIHPKNAINRIWNVRDQFWAAAL